MKMPAFLNLVLQPCGTHCNMACAYCYARHGGAADPVGARPATEYFLNWYPALLEGVGEMAGVSQLRFTWHGGEPLLASPRFFESVIGMQRRLLPGLVARWDNVLMTNGVLLDDTFQRVLRSLDVSIGISCDGPLHRHNALRMPCERDFQRLLQNIDRTAQGGAFSLVVVVHEDNWDAPDEVFEMVRRLRPGNGVSLTPCAGADPSVSPEDFAAFLLRLYDLWTQDRELGIALFQNVERGLEFGIPAFCQLVGGRCKSFMTITASGSVHSGCEVRPDGRYHVGELMHEPVGTLVQRHLDRSQALVNSLSNDSLFEQLGEDLPYMYFQGHGCPHRADATGRDPYAPAFATLIKHVHRSNAERFARARARRFPDLDPDLAE